MQSTSGTTLWKFLGIFFLVFFVTATLLHMIDFVPEGSDENMETNQESTLGGAIGTGEVPVSVRIPAVGVDTRINNPEVTDIEVLDDALLSGAVRYPGSALLGDNAPMFLFGHQSQLPVVRNQAFKAFNNLQDLKEGDIISVYSDETEYQYTVRSVTKVLAEEALIPLAEGEQTLVLSTCNSFGDPGERFVVEADFVGTVAL